MQVASTLDFTKYTPDELCHYLEHKHFEHIKHQFEAALVYFQELHDEHLYIETEHLLVLLFKKLKEEVLQLIRRDTLIIFPLISNNENQPSFVSSLQAHKRIIDILQKIRNLTNNYIQQPEWSKTYKFCCIELLELEEQIQEVIYIKENFILQKPMLHE